MPAYTPRIVDAELRQLLASAGAVVIEGLKACGKTMTATQQAASRVLLDIDPAARLALEVEPGLVLEGARPVPAHRFRRAGGGCQPPHRRGPFCVSADVADVHGGNRFVQRGRVTA